MTRGLSSERQARGDTVASQLAALRERTAVAGLSVEAGDEVIDEGTSGTTRLRPALERLRDAVAAGVLDQVHVLAPDRLARRSADQVLLVEGFGRAGVEVVVANHPIGVGAEDDLLLRAQGMIAEDERGPDPRAQPPRPAARRALGADRRSGQGALRHSHHRQGRGRWSGARGGRGRGRPLGSA